MSFVKLFLKSCHQSIGQLLKNHTSDTLPTPHPLTPFEGLSLVNFLHTCTGQTMLSILHKGECTNKKTAAVRHSCTIPRNFDFDVNLSEENYTFFPNLDTCRWRSAFAGHGMGAMFLGRTGIMISSGLSPLALVSSTARSISGMCGFSFFT